MRASIGAIRRSSAHQFGTKHMLIWAAAMAPLLVVARGMEFLIFSDLDYSTTFQSVWLSLGIATLNLVAIWAVLGSGPRPLRIAALIMLPLVLALGVERYADSLHPGLGQSWTTLTFMLEKWEANGHLGCGSTPSFWPRCCCFCAPPVTASCAATAVPRMRLNSQCVFEFAARF